MCTRLREAGDNCMAGRFSKRRTCAQPVVLGLCPKLKYPPFYGEDIYFKKIKLKKTKIVRKTAAGNIRNFMHEKHKTKGYFARTKVRPACHFFLKNLVNRKKWRISFF